MEKFVLATRRFMRDEEGVTAIEYGLIASLVAVAIILGASALGGQLDQLFKDIAACLGDEAGGGTCPISTTPATPPAAG